MKVFCLDFTKDCEIISESVLVEKLATCGLDVHSSLGEKTVWMVGSREW